MSLTQFTGLQFQWQGTHVYKVLPVDSVYAGNLLAATCHNCAFMDFCFPYPLNRTYSLTMAEQRSHTRQLLRRNVHQLGEHGNRNRRDYCTLTYGLVNSGAYETVLRITEMNITLDLTEAPIARSLVTALGSFP